MCGIAGYFSQKHKPGTQTAIAVAILAREMESRGNHSWGCMGDVEVSRNLGPISQGFTVPQRLSRNFALHTRYATTGKVKASNSHPFTLSGKVAVTGMHNGIISNHERMNKVYGRTCRVDSEHIFAHLADSLPLSDLEGYGTIVYRIGSTWYLGTFNGGEIAVASTSAGIFFASTFKALDRALMTAGLRDSARDIILKDNHIYRLTADGFKVEAKLCIPETSRRWNDDLLFPSAKKKGKGTGKEPLSLSADSTAAWKEYVGSLYVCRGCGDSLPFDVDTDICDNCVDSEDFEVEIVPSGYQVRCEFCKTVLEEGEEFGVSEQGVEVCMDCLTELDTPANLDTGGLISAADVRGANRG